MRRLGRARLLGAPKGTPKLRAIGIVDVTFGKKVTVVQPVNLYDCTIGDDMFVTGGPAGKPQLWRPTKLGNRVSIGTNATILPVAICDQVVIGAGAVVTKDITVSGIYAGNPARLLRRL